MNMSAVSIIIPVHNTAQYVKKCVDSITGQTLTDIEIIIVENNSSDTSAELCDRIAATDDRIKILHLDIADVSSARNRGIDIASGEYIGFVDSDDYIMPEMYSELYNAAKTYDADLVFCNFRMVRDGHTEQKHTDSGDTVPMSVKDVISGIFNETVSSSPCTKLFRRRLFEKWRFPEGHFFEDHDTIYRIVADCTGSCVHIDKSFYYYYQRQDSTCHNVTPEKRYHYFIADFNRIEYIENSPLFSEDEKSILTKQQLSICINHFKVFLQTPGQAERKDEMLDMRDRLLSRKWKHASFRSINALFRIKFFWNSYYRKHKR